MVDLLNWRMDGVMLWWICVGHSKWKDGTFVHTSPYEKVEVCEDGLSVVTFSGTNYLCQVKNIDLNVLEQTKEALAFFDVDVSFLNNALEVVENAKKEKAEEVSKILNKRDLYLEFVDVFVKDAFFKDKDKIVPLKCRCHISRYHNSYLIQSEGLVDVRYFPESFGISFYHISDGVNNIHFKHSGKDCLTVKGIGEDFELKENETIIKKIKPENCNEELMSPDCVNGRCIWCK